MKSPKHSPPVMEALSCSPGGSSPVNSQTSNTNSTSNNTANNNNSSSSNTNNNNNNNNTNNNNNVANSSNANVTNGTSTNSNSSVTPKLEHSPPEHYERQTVLMWGATSNNTNSSANHRSPSTTPTSNGLYAGSDGNHMKHNNQMVMSPGGGSGAGGGGGSGAGGVEHYTKRSTSNSHMKWSESKEIPVTGVYQLHAHQDSTAAASDTASMYAQVSHSPHLSHHSGSTGSAASAGHIVSPDQSGLHHSPQNTHPTVLQQATSQHQTVGSSCEVWSPAYSQYQYFTYHHAPQHANTQ